MFLGGVMPLRRSRGSGLILLARFQKRAQPVAHAPSDNQADKDLAGGITAISKNSGEENA